MKISPTLFKQVSDFMSNREGFKHITNVLSGIIVLLLVTLTIDNLSDVIADGNVPVIITGMFPIFASIGMFVGVLIVEPMSLLRVLYLFGMFTTLLLGV